MTDRENSATEPTESFLSKLLAARVDRRTTGAIALATVAAAAGCTTPNQPSATDSAKASASAPETTRQTPFEKYYENVPAELRARIEAMKAKTSQEREQAPWENRELYALGLALEREYNGQFTDNFIDTKTGIGSDGDSLLNHTPIETPLNVSSSGQDIWEQQCYFYALLASMMTRETQRGFLPLAGAEGSPMYDFYAKTIIPNNEPGEWVSLQAAPAFSATRGKEYEVTVEGKQVLRCDLRLTSGETGKSFTQVQQFTEEPLLEAVLTLAGKPIGANKPGIWTAVSEK